MTPKNVAIVAASLRPRLMKARLEQPPMSAIVANVAMPTASSMVHTSHYRRPPVTKIDWNWRVIFSRVQGPNQAYINACEAHLHVQRPI